MYRKDYLVRQFEELGKVLGVLLFLKKEKDWDNFEKEIALAARKFTSFEIGYIEKLDLSAFKKEVVENENVGIEQKRMLAGILFEKLDYYGANNLLQEQKDCAAKCLELYSFLHNNQTQNEFNLETFYRLEFLKKAEF